METSGPTRRLLRLCPNCGSNLNFDREVCDRCYEHVHKPGSGRPRFTDEARDTGEMLGGLLRLHAVEGVRVHYVGWCPAGAFGLCANGSVIWTEDWGYMASLTVDHDGLRFEGRLADMDTGRLVQDVTALPRSG